MEYVMFFTLLSEILNKNMWNLTDLMFCELEANQFLIAKKNLFVFVVKFYLNSDKDCYLEVLWNLWLKIYRFSE